MRAKWTAPAAPPERAVHFRARKTGRKDMIDAIVEKLELDTRRVMLEFDEDSAEDRETIARVYRHARVVVM